MRIVAASRHPIEPRPTARALALGFESEGQRLPLPAVELLTAQSFLETGGYTTGHNYGNESAAGFDANGVEHSAWNGDAWRPPWFRMTAPLTDVDPKKATTYQRMKGYTDTLGAYHAPDAPSAFRSFATAEQGLRNHVLALRAYFPAVVDAAATGDVEAFRRAVITKDPKTGRRYSPDYSPAATKTLIDLRAKFRAAHVFDGIAVSSPSNWAAVGAAVAAVVLWRLFK